VDSKGIFYSAITIFLITFAIRASNNMIITTIPLLADYYFHFTPLLIGIVSSFASIFSFISSIFVNSKLSSNLRRRVFILSSFLYAFTFPLFYFVNPILVWIFSSIAGFSMGIIFPNIITYAGSIGNQRTRERMLSLYTTSLSLSLILSPFIESLILSTFTLIQSFLFFSIISSIIPIIAFKVKFSGSSKINFGNSGILKSAGFLVSLFNNIMYDIPFGMIETFGGIYAITLFHVSYSTAISLFTLYFLTSFISRTLFTIKPPFRVINLIFFNSIISIVGLSLASVSKDIYMYIFSLLLLGIPHGLTYPSSLVLLSRSFSDEETRSIANSYFSGILIGLAAVIPIAMATSVEFIGLRYSFALLSGVVLFFLLLVMREYHRINQNT
jgi:DHA1 family multidrug resistance protein-like MFS transporter